MSRRTLAVSVLVLALVVAVVPYGGVTGEGALSGRAQADHNPMAQFEIIPGDPTPGANGTTYSAFAWGLRNYDGPVDAEYVHHITLVGPASGEENCVIARDARAAGFDRGNDDPGTETDESMLGRFKFIGRFETDSGQPGITVQFFDEDDVGGDGAHLNHTDEAVAKVANCIKNPEEPGWYRWWAYANGTGWDGRFKEGATLSHWFHICDCSDREDAVETIGPPPDGPDSETDYFRPDYDPGRPSGPFDLMVTREPGNTTTTDTPTLTPTEESTATATGTATPTATPKEATATGTATATATGTATATETATGTATATATDADVETPSGDGSPGFGLLAALLALVLFALAGRGVHRK